ncbi:MAG: hypothetical protein Q8P67_14455, partial [archaeon]|nr:hypothetical protein [archaeon]
MRQVAEGQTYNLWYQKTEGRVERVRRSDRARQGPGGINSAAAAAAGGEREMLRCDPLRDSGRTAGSERGVGYVCLHFARGECTLGSGCSYLHRVPGEEDSERLDELHDIFGRERHREAKDDMGGVGSFLSSTRTLYLGNLPPLRCSLQEYYRLVAMAFGVWGPLENLRVLRDKCIAFVTYRWRPSAEFAKEAMIDQRLTDSAPQRLNVRWARPDPNPAAQQRLQLAVQRLALKAVQERLQDRPSLPLPAHIEQALLARESTTSGSAPLLLLPPSQTTDSSTASTTTIDVQDQDSKIAESPHSQDSTSDDDSTGDSTGDGDDDDDD